MKAGPLNAPPTTKSGPMNKDTLKQAALPTSTPSASRRYGPVSKPVVKHCELCGTEFSFKSSGQANNAKRRFCSNLCAATWRMTQPKIKNAILPNFLEGQAQAAQRRRGTKDPRASARMKANNPMSMPGVLEKVKAALKGREFKHRGGNGSLTAQQIAIRDATGMVTEHAVNTKPVRYLVAGIPKHYKLDLAHPEMLLAVEVDGQSHRTTAGRERDARKDAALAALGWSVLRFSNEEVTANLPMVLEKIRASIALR